MDGSTKATYTLSTIVTLYGFSVQELVAIGGLAIAGFTALHNAWDKRQRRKMIKDALEKGQIHEIPDY